LRRAGAAAALVLLAAATVSAQDAVEDGDDPAREASAEASPETEATIAVERKATVIHSQEEDPENVGTPIFPQARYWDAVRLRLQSHFVPRSDFGAADVALYSPSARLRVTLPVSDRGVLQFTGRGGTSQYTFSGSTDWFGLGPTSSGPVEGLYSLLLALQGAYRLNDAGYVFVDGESWSVLGGVFGRSRWEGNDIADGWTGGGFLSVGYQNARLRMALGARLESRLIGSGVKVSPVATIRWDPTKWLTVRNRGTGLQIEYGLTNRLELFAAGYVSSDRYRLADRAGVAGPLTLRDRQVLAGVGFEWKLSRYFRINVEGGVVASHEIKVRSDDATLSSLRADPAGYFDIRIAVRP
jgi:hypothetical protein